MKSIHPTVLGVRDAVARAKSELKRSVAVAAINLNHRSWAGEVIGISPSGVVKLGQPRSMQLV